MLSVVSPTPTASLVPKRVLIRELFPEPVIPKNIISFLFIFFSSL